MQGFSIYEKIIIMGQNIEKNIEILTRKIARDQQLLANWKANNISQRKIDNLEAKIARDEDRLAELEAL